MQRNGTVWITLPQAAKLAGVSRVTVWRWVKAKELKTKKVGKLRVRRREVEEFCR